jgi:hypothetical protein
MLSKQASAISSSTITAGVICRITYPAIFVIPEANALVAETNCIGYKFK